MVIDRNAEGTCKLSLEIATIRGCLHKFSLNEFSFKTLSFLP
jgi:hypothetical protein